MNIFECFELFHFVESPATLAWQPAEHKDQYNFSSLEDLVWLAGISKELS